MKNNKLNIAFALIAFTGIAYFTIDALKMKMDRIYRYAAGESDYERTHPKKRK